ncbi:TPA: hypothetical protein ACGSTF_004724 [Pseudomonas aeruginosa]
MNIQQMIGQLEGQLNLQVLTLALQGDCLRQLKSMGQAPLAAQAADGNELKGQLLVQMADRLVLLIRSGSGLADACDLMRREGWLIRHDNLTAQE